jgi:NAD(P)-dependent dehydrogenase (short-subunit alcohol dehydrogenase family)
METVLVVGSTGHIGASAVTAALRSKRNVLAVVRNEASANKLVKHVGASEGITFAEADILSGNGVRSVVDRVRAGELPAFQHVYSAGEYGSQSTLRSVRLTLLSRRFLRANSAQGHHDRRTALLDECQL